jgi:hypothetical protein
VTVNVSFIGIKENEVLKWVKIKTLYYLPQKPLLEIMNSGNKLDVLNCESNTATVNRS